MKRLFYASLPLLFSFLCISAQPYKIAVLPFKSFSNHGINHSIPDMIMTNLENSKKFTIVERVQIDSAIQHFQTEQSELLTDATAVEFGQWIGADAVIIGNYVQEGEQVRIDARVVDVKSGTPINSAKVQGLSYEIFALVENLSEEILISLTGVNLNSVKDNNYYFQPGNQLLRIILGYEVVEQDFRNSMMRSFQEPVAYLGGKLNTGEILDLSKLLYPGNSDAINLESDTRYQIAFSGNLRFQAIVFSAGYKDGLDLGSLINIDIEFYGTDTFTLRLNETNKILVDIGRPPQIRSTKGRLIRMKCQLQVLNK